MEALPSKVLVRITCHPNKNEVISLTTALPASAQKWQSGSIIELPERSKRVLENHPEYPAIDHFVLSPWPSILADKIAAMLQ